MLTLTIDGRNVELATEDVMFFVDSMHAALSRRGQSFERTHRGAASVFRISAGAAMRELPPGVQSFGDSATLVGKVQSIFKRSTPIVPPVDAVPVAALTDC